MDEMFESFINPKIVNYLSQNSMLRGIFTNFPIEDFLSRIENFKGTTFLATIITGRCCFIPKLFMEDLNSDKSIIIFKTNEKETSKVTIGEKTFKYENFKGDYNDCLMVSVEEESGSLESHFYRMSKEVKLQ